MCVEDVRDDVVSGPVLPDALVASELEEVHPGRKAKLISRQPAIRSQPSRRVYVAVVGLIRLVGLLYPQCHRLRDQRFELDVAR